MLHKVCPSCGLLAGPGPVCAGCKQPLDGTLDVPPSQFCWAYLSCDFVCRACGFTSPLGHVDVDGSVQCAHCGLVQAFDVGGWGDVLAMAHDVADVAGPSAGSRAIDPAFSELSIPPLSMLEPGAWVSRSVGGGTTLEMQVTPGHPTCWKCGVLRTVHSAGPGQIVMVCPRCDERVSYNHPGPTTPYAPLVAAIAEEHRVDRQPVGVRGEGTAIALTCPSCDAPLPLHGNSRIVTCSYCHTTAYVPSQAWRSMREGEVGHEPFWVCFSGPSPLRARAEKQARKEMRLAAIVEDVVIEDEPALPTCPRCGAYLLASDDPCHACGLGVAWYVHHSTLLIVGGSLLFAVVMAGSIVAFSFRDDAADVSSFPDRHAASEKEASQCSEADPKACVQQGLRVERMDPKRAEELYANACRYKDGQGCFNEGVMAWKRNDRAFAVSRFQAACDLDYAMGCGNLAGVLTDKKDPRAEAVAKKGCDLGSALSCSNLAKLLDDRGKKSDAIRVGRRACDKGSVHACADLCSFLVDQGKGAAGLKAATRAVEMDREFAWGQACLGYALALQGEADDSVRALRRAVILSREGASDNGTLDDAPMDVRIRKDLEDVAKHHPKRRRAIRAVLARRAEWAPEAP